jgi:hypothetical protein
MRTRIASTLLLAVVSAIPAAAQTADEIVAKALEARGGVARLRAVQSERISGRISFGPDAEGPFVVEFKRPAKFHMELTIEGKKMTRSFNGKSAGWTINPFAGDTEAKAMTPDEVRNIGEEADFDGPFIDYQAKGNQVERMGKETIEGKAAWRLKLTMKSGTVRFYLVDAVNFQLLKWEGKRTDAGGKEIDVESSFHDYRDVKGLKFAFEILSGSPGGGPGQKILVEKIEIDPAIDDAHFGKPEAAAPGQ